MASERVPFRMLPRRLVHLSRRRKTPKTSEKLLLPDFSLDISFQFGYARMLFMEEWWKFSTRTANLSDGNTDTAAFALDAMLCASGVSPGD